MIALMVSHGQPSDPEAAERALADLARAVTSHLPGAEIRVATLAAPGALDRALRGATGLVLPLFMAGGWFTRTYLPKRLAEAGGAGWQLLEPLGCDPAVQDLAVAMAREALPATRLILAAHGSGRSPVPGAIAERLAARMTQELGLPAQAAFIDQAPRLADLRGHDDATVCLPFFAAAGEHVTEDLPRALAEAGFQGRTLTALGLDPRLARIIAEALRVPRSICAGPCRAA